MATKAMKKMKSRRGGVGTPIAPEATGLSAYKKRLAEQKKHAAGMKKKRAEKKAGKSWTKAVKAQKKTGGPTLSELIKRRSAAKKGTAEYAAAQNAINKAYGVKKRHKVTSKPKPKKVTTKPKPKKVTTKPKWEKSSDPDAGSRSASKKVGEDIKKGGYQYGGRVPSPSMGVRRRGARPSPMPIPGRSATPTPPGINPVTPGPAQQRPVQSYDEGGKVEGSNPYGWPSRDARNGGKK